MAPNFNPEVGFLSRDGYRKIELSAFNRFRPEGGIFQELRPHTSYRGWWNFDGFQETGHWHIDNHWEFRNSSEIHTGVNLTREGVVNEFEISPGIFVPPGTYDHKELSFVAFSNRGAPISANVRVTAGGFFGGDRLQLGPGVNFRIGDSFNGEVEWSRNDIDLPGGAFITNLGRARLSYSFTPRIFVQTLMQYNDRSHTFSTNLRFGWLQAANTGLFIVLNDTRGIEGFDIPGDRSLIVKFSRMFDLLD